MSEDRKLSDQGRRADADPEDRSAEAAFQRSLARARRPREAFARILRPREELTPSQWAEKFLVVYKGPDAGKPLSFGGGREWQREPLDKIFGAFAPGETWREASVQKGSQMGFTLIMLVGLLYWFVFRRSSVGIVSPRNPDASDRAAELAEMIRMAPACAEAFKHLAGRVKRGYQGQEFHSRSTQSQRELISWSAPVIALDENDHHGELEYGIEPLLTKRQGAYYQRIMARLSTPTFPDVGINKSFEASDKRRYHVRCPFSRCAAWQALTWEENIRFEKGDLEHEVKTARFQCAACRWEWNQAARVEANRLGEWVAEHPTRAHLGYHASRLLVPAASAGEFVRELRGSKDDEAAQREAHNQLLALGYLSQIGRPPLAILRARITGEVLWRDVPAGVLRICAGVDAQGEPPNERFFLEVRAYRPDGFCFLIFYDGDLTEDQLVSHLDARWGSQRRLIDRCLIDSSDGDHVAAVERIVFRLANQNTQAAKWDNSITANFCHANLIQGDMGYSGYAVHREMALANNYGRFYPTPEGDYRIAIAAREQHGRQEDWVDQYNHIKRVKLEERGRVRWFYDKVRNERVDYPFAGALAEVAWRIEQSPRETEQNRQRAARSKDPAPKKPPASPAPSNVRRSFFAKKGRFFK